MTAVAQYQNYGSELLEQPCHVIWLNAENPEEEVAIRKLIGKAGFGGLTGYHSIDENNGDESTVNEYPKTFIFRMPDNPK